MPEAGKTISHYRIFKRIGVTAVILGLVLLHDLVSAPVDYFFGPFLGFFGPMFLTVGILFILTAWYRKNAGLITNVTASAKLRPDTESSVSGKTILRIGFSMMAIPALLLIVTPFSGVYKKTIGWFGMLTFLTLWLPGLIITVRGFNRWMESKVTGAGAVMRNNS